MTDSPENSTADNGNIDLSVIVVTRVDQAQLDRCLEALTKQETTASFEVIIPADESLGDVNAMIMRYRCWEFVRTHGTQTHAQLRSLGVHHARGRLVATTEDHCLPEANWVQAIVDEHANAPVAIGGVVEKVPPDDALNWAVYFHDYLRYMPPAEAGETHELSALNASYKMSALREVAGSWQREFHEADVHGALEAHGGTLWLSPNIMVKQRRNLEIEHALWERYAFGRLFASTRTGTAAPGRCLLYAALSPIQPVLLLARLGGHIRRKQHHRMEFFMALPATLLLATAWAFGEFMGYVTRKPDPRLEPQPDPEPWPDP
ncbi:MAG: glycosyltransferase [Gammaproteobacteria bacterium]|nr:glycosyltransferase [Gammaproteobacteria bacterium]